MAKTTRPEPASARNRSLLGLARQGWLGIAIWMAVGLLLEGLLGYKIPAYLSDPVRREMFRLAHTHGTLLNFLLVLAALWSERQPASPKPMVTLCLRAGSVLMPLGFLFAGVWHYESDPGLSIWLVPIGALLIIFGVIALGLSARAPES